MKKIALVLTLAAVLALCVACAAPEDPDAPSGMKLCSGEEADYLFYVPSEWIVDRSGLYSAAYYSAGDATSISASAYNVPVTVTTVADWWKTYQPSFEKTLSEMNVTEEKETLLGGETAVWYAFDAQVAGESYRYVIVAAKRGNNVYYLTYTSTPDFYEKHLSDLDRVIDAFAFR